VGSNVVVTMTLAIVFPWCWIATTPARDLSRRLSKLVCQGALLILATNGAIARGLTITAKRPRLSKRRLTVKINIRAPTLCAIPVTATQGMKSGARSKGIGQVRMRIQRPKDLPDDAVA